MVTDSVDSNLDIGWINRVIGDRSNQLLYKVRLSKLGVRHIYGQSEIVTPKIEPRFEELKSSTRGPIAS